MARLPRHQNRWEHLVGSLSRATAQDSPTAGTHLNEVTAFGTNPGNLRMFRYLPSDLAADPALVVVLHGCTQTAAGYDLGAGWSTLADRYGFALLLPEQQRSNNPNGCFNWFQPGDIERGSGEALSIRQMIEKMITDTGVDRRRVFVTGLSAGGAMTSVMLACYPEVFAGGAIIAGLPYGAATNVQQAFQSMYQCPARSAREWGDLVRGAASHKGAWPHVSIWHGSADKTVVPDNAREILKQWTDVHGLALTPAAQDMVDGYPRQAWVNAAGEEVIEFVRCHAHGSWHASRNGRSRWRMRRGRSVPARSRHLFILSHREILRAGPAPRCRFGASGCEGPAYRSSCLSEAHQSAQCEWKRIRRCAKTSGRSSHGYRRDHHQGPESRGTDEGIGQRLVRAQARRRFRFRRSVWRHVPLTRLPRLGHEPSESRRFAVEGLRDQVLDVLARHGPRIDELASGDDLHRLRNVGFFHAETLQSGRQANADVEVIETLARVLDAERAGNEIHRARRGLGVERNGVRREDRVAVRVIKPNACLTRCASACSTPACARKAAASQAP